MKKVIFFLLGVAFAISASATTGNPPATSESVLPLAAPAKGGYGPVFLELDRECTSGSLRSSTGEAAVDVYIATGYLQLIINMPNQYLVVIENSYGEEVYAGTITPTMSSFSIPTVYYPADAYRITIYNVDRTEYLSGQFYIE